MPFWVDHNSNSDVLVPSAKLNGTLWHDGRIIGCLHGDGICEALSPGPQPCSFVLC